MGDAVHLSSSKHQHLCDLEDFLRQRVYEDEKVSRTDRECKQIVLALAEAYRRDPSTLPPRFAARIQEQGRTRVICDFLAGMTDRYCRREHARLVDPENEFS